MYREYLYYFVEEDLNIEKMKEAAKEFVGLHNFFHFCKKDGKEDQNYK